MNDVFDSCPGQLLRITGLSLSLLFVCVGCDETEQPLPPIDVPTMTPMIGGPASTPFIVPPQVDLKMLQASTLQIDSAAAVIGVIADGTARCYLLQAMKDMQSHVVNENRTERPFCVTYCDRTDTVRVLAGGDDDMLEVQTAGFDSGQMLILHSGTIFGQKSEEIPLEDLSYERSSWGEWIAAHPESLVYVGNLAVGSGPQKEQEENAPENGGSSSGQPEESDPDI